jgi:hypothetical protein
MLWLVAKPIKNSEQFQRSSEQDHKHQFRTGLRKIAFLAIFREPRFFAPLFFKKSGTFNLLINIRENTSNPL